MRGTSGVHPGFTSKTAFEIPSFPPAASRRGKSAPGPEGNPAAHSVRRNRPGSLLTTHPERPRSG
ncbi:hypothetical protein HMPREF9440_01791 [Sutterella parvirubra YIT 11816]|uniref:Uncharacterized protein n=1 Tax=Sutterella parvirubra YIT 11816 TaxID=762967 RepID=H3KGB2_9BURK|nr:hypothetical protein HMPREF9440_01791 [Sutterella parvirubra YIT 11816]